MSPDFGKLDPRTALRWGLWLLLGLLLALGVRALTASGPAEHDPSRDILAADLARRMHANSLALDSARRELARAQSKVERHVAGYKPARDTLNIHDTVQVKVFVERADSVVRSCTALAESCDRFRVRADSTIAGLRLDRDRWRLEAEHARPSGFDLFVRRTLPVVGFVAGVWVGSKVTQ